MDPRFEEAFRRARNGDPRAFRTITEHLGPELVRYLTFFLQGDGHAAHDAAQETLARAWHSLDTIADPLHLKRWCYRVARCKAVSWLRRRTPPGKRVESLDRRYDDGDRVLDVPAQPTAHPEGDDLLAALKRAMKDLPVRYAGPVHLFYVQGYDTRETARLLGIRRETVKMQLHRARRILKRAIHEDVARRQGSPKSAPEETS